MTIAPTPNHADFFAGFDRMRAKYSTLGAAARDALADGAPPPETRAALQAVARYADEKLHATSVVREGFATACAP